MLLNVEGLVTFYMADSLEEPDAPAPVVDKLESDKMNLSSQKEEDDQPTPEEVLDILS